MISQDKSRRKVSGGRYRKGIKKLKNRGGLPVLTKVGKNKVKKIKGRGKTIKYKLLTAETINVYDPSKKQYFKAKIESVVENPANRHYVRRNIITKGTVVKTDKGNAKVLNRPGQENLINGILIKKSS